MQTNTLKVIIAVFFIAHAFIHISLTWVPIPKPGAMRTPFFPCLEEGGYRSKMADQ